MGMTIITAKTIKMPDEKQLRSWTAARQREFWVCRRNFWGKQRLHHLQKQCAQQGLSAEGHKEVSFHDIAVIWVAFFSRRQRYRCQQDLVTRIACAEFHAGLQDHDYAGSEGGEHSCLRAIVLASLKAPLTPRFGTARGFRRPRRQCWAARRRGSQPRLPAQPGRGRKHRQQERRGLVQRRIRLPAAARGRGGRRQLGAEGDDSQPALRPQPQRQCVPQEDGGAR